MLSSGTVSPEMCVGFAESCKIAKFYQMRGFRKNAEELIEKFVKGLIAIGFNFRINGPKDAEGRLPGTINILFEKC